MRPVEPDETWMNLGRCRETDPEAFFPEKGGSVAAAKQVCGGCEVKTDCLAYAIAHGERFGVWGGLSERERRQLIRAATKPNARPTTKAIEKLIQAGMDREDIADKAGVSRRTIDRHWARLTARQNKKAEAAA